MLKTKKPRSDGTRFPTTLSKWCDFLWQVAGSKLSTGFAE